MILRHGFPLALVALGFSCSPPSNGMPDASRTDGAVDAHASDTLDVTADVTDTAIDSPVDVPIDVAVDASSDADTVPLIPFCTLGEAVPGATVPTGYCIRRFAGPAAVQEPRTMAFAPNGDLFVGAPMGAGAGGGTGGPGALLVLSDDDHDGIAEVHTYLSGINDIHGVAVGPDAIYFTTNSAVMSTPYTAGQRSGTSMSMVATIPNPGRWTHGLSRSVGGALYVTNGSTSYVCPDPAPADQSGWIQRVQSDGSLAMIASGFRNPMYTRCHFADETCFATELGDDGGGGWGAHEKLLMIHPSTDYGYPCCNEPGVPDGPPGSMSCASITTEEAQFTLNDTPFGLDWERGIWTDGTYRNALFVAKHGSFYSFPEWAGEGVFYAPTDPVTHAPTGPFVQFVSGFGPDDSRLPPPPSEMRRPCDLTFAPDGRMFFSDDLSNGIFFVAPLTLGR